MEDMDSMDTMGMEEHDEKSGSGSGSEIVKVEPQLLAKWSAMQDELKSQVVMHNTESWQDDFSKFKLLAGMDISYPVNVEEENANTAVACVVICSFPDMKPIKTVTETIELEEPYIPGFLAFRESAPLLKILQEIIESEPNLKPDVILVDGNGILHPRKYGCACHIGLKSGIPTIGVAKNIYRMEKIDFDKSKILDLKKTGDYVLIKEDDEVLGMALKTGEGAKNPVYVSIGHKISLEVAMKVVISSSKYRVPEPLRFADFNSREVLRQRTSDLSKSHKE